MASYSHRPSKLHVRNTMTKQTNTIETFILTLSESQKLYNIRNQKRKHNRKSKIYKQIVPTGPAGTNTDTTPTPNQDTSLTTTKTKRIKPPLFYDSPLRGIR